MKDKILLLAPAKINIFLRILGRKFDGYHSLRSGITLINLFDEISIERSSKMQISYIGDFKPKKEYNDCIIKKTLEFINISKNLDIKIKKNIPVQGGLGSASTNAATLIKGLDILKLIKKKDPKHYVKLGSDIPFFLYNKDCLVTGIGEKLYPQNFPKYFFLLIKPKFGNLTKDLYSSLGYKIGSYESKFDENENKIIETDTGNDFEKVILKKNKKFKDIINFLESLDNVIFTRMTGSGSCCFATFEKKEYAIRANNLFKLNFPNLWSVVCENNFI